MQIYIVVGSIVGVVVGLVAAACFFFAKRKRNKQLSSFSMRDVANHVYGKKA